MRLALGILFLVLGVFGLWVYYSLRVASQEAPGPGRGDGDARRTTGSIGWSIANLALGLWFLARHFGVIG